MKVLSPVKNYDSARVVIQSNCDEIYLGSPNFSARNKVNINENELQEIIDYSNAYGVNTYVAFNTVIFEDELDSLINEIIKVYNMGASGIIIQDISLSSLIKKNCPDLEIHASTQMNINNINAIKLCKDNGMNRVVVPREMTFDRIKNIKDNIDIELEAFIHGAICVSYSGQCYDSVLLDQKSANRGRCSQYCRFEQGVYKNDKKINDLKFALNIKDMNNIELIDNYLNSGIDSLKIEGRLKNLDYAGLTAMSYSSKKDLGLNKVYNRTHTTGLINSTKTKELVNNNRINNTGELVGKVVRTNKNCNNNLKYYKYEVVITCKELNSNDNIRYVSGNYEDGQVIEKFEKLDNNKYKVYSNCKVNVEDDVYITHNENLFKHFNELKDKFVRKVDINVSIDIDLNKCSFIYKDTKYNYEVDIQKAIKNSVTKDIIKSELSKTSKSFYNLMLDDIKLEENLFIRSSDLRKFKNYILQIIKEDKTIRRNSKFITYNTNKDFTNSEDKQFFIEVRTLEQYKLAKKYSNNVLINGLKLISNIEYDNEDIIVLPSVIYDDQFSMYEKYIDMYDKLCVSELGMYNKYKDSHTIITNYTLNSTNNLNLNFLNCHMNILSLELNKSRINSITNSNSGLVIYGHIPVMTMDYCPINPSKKDGCGSCTLCHSNEYYLKDYKNRVFNLMHDSIDKLTMLSSKPLYLYDDINDIDINNYIIRFTVEDYDQTSSVLNAIFNNDKVMFEYENKTLYKEVL